MTITFALNVNLSCDDKLLGLLKQSAAALVRIANQGEHIVTDLENLKNEVTETKEAVTSMAASVGSTIARVTGVIEQLQAGEPTPGDMEAMAETLNTTQEALATAKAALDQLAVPPAPPVVPVDPAPVTDGAQQSTVAILD